jgi:hypothetical protein
MKVRKKSGQKSMAFEKTSSSQVWVNKKGLCYRGITKGVMMNNVVHEIIIL